jgi:hypothetical protein
METYKPFNQPSHQPVQGASTGGHELKNVLGFSVILKSAFNRSTCPFDSTDTNQLLLQIFCGVGQEHLTTM